MVDKLKKISSRRIIAGTATALVALFVFSGLFSFVTETAARKNGSLTTQTMQAQDFAWSGIAVKDGAVITTDNDPQMITEYTGKITSIKMYMESSVHPGEMTVYYTQPGDRAFSVHKRLWLVPVRGQPGWFMVETPVKNITSLRIDPTMYAGNILTFGDIVINSEKTFGEYFSVSYGDFFNLFLYTGVVSSVLKFLQEMIKREFD